MDCKSFLFLFLVLVSFLLLFPGVDYFSSSQKEPQFEYFSLVLQWPNSFCHLHADKCNIYPVPRDFTIHGLWPDNVTVELRDCITAPIFDPTILIIELKTKLNEYWPDLTNSNPKALSLVESQWHKHGRCAYPYYSQVAYLWKAVDLRLTANVLEFLKEDNISPDDNRFVAVSDISKAIWAKTGSVHPTIKCSGDYLVEIVICFDSFGLEAIECPKRGSQQCGRPYVVFPRTPYVM